MLLKWDFTQRKEKSRGGKSSTSASSLAEKIQEIHIRLTHESLEQRLNEIWEAITGIVYKKNRKQQTTEPEPKPGKSMLLKQGFSTTENRAYDIKAGVEGYEGYSASVEHSKFFDYSGSTRTKANYYITKEKKDKATTRNYSGAESGAEISIETVEKVIERKKLSDRLGVGEEYSTLREKEDYKWWKLFNNSLSILKYDMSLT